ncbi:MAG TPA: ParA family protein [Candidatus Paceibacterota bacterium]|nr:ParA family protein [Candidatus Paceibacterota bacterium]
MARVIAVCNQKGGVGKTTTAVNTAAYCAARGKRALLVDFDPQANASSALGVSPLEITQSVYHGILGQAEPKALIHSAAIRNFHLLPAAPHLAGALVELVPLEGREYYLRRFLNNIRHEYDYIFIDLPPSLSLLTVNGLLASDEVIIPVQAEYYSLEGLGQLLQTIELIRTNLGHPLKVAGALLTMYDKREKLSRDVAKELRAHFPHRVFEAQIPRNVALAEAPSFAKPILLYRPDSSGALAYERFADELISEEATFKEAAYAGAPTGDFGNFNVTFI